MLLLQPVDAVPFAADDVAHRSRTAAAVHGSGPLAGAGGACGGIRGHVASIKRAAWQVQGVASAFYGRWRRAAGRAAGGTMPAAGAAAARRLVRALSRQLRQLGAGARARQLDLQYLGCTTLLSSCHLYKIVQMCHKLASDR